MDPLDQPEPLGQRGPGGPAGPFEPTGLLSPDLPPLDQTGPRGPTGPLANFETKFFFALLMCHKNIWSFGPVGPD